jgi:hypothetical protein
MIYGGFNQVSNGMQMMTFGVLGWNEAEGRRGGAFPPYGLTVLDGASSLGWRRLKPAATRYCR